MICYAKLKLDYDIGAIQSEVKKLLETRAWIPHFNKLHYEGSWNVLPLRAPGGESDNTCADLIGHREFKDTLLMDALPGIRNLLNQLHCEKLSVRLLNLKAGSVIKPHKDLDLAYEKGEARLHFPLFTNPGVEFFIEEERLKMKEGECWYINANLIHQAANYGNEDRVHLVADCTVNAWIDKLFKEGDSFCREERKDRNEQLLIIENLRIQNTPAALALANKLELELRNG